MNIHKYCKESAMTLHPRRAVSGTATTSHPGGVTTRPDASLTTQEHTPAAGSPRTGPLPDPSGGALPDMLPIAMAKFQEGIGRVVGFWIANCPGCRSTKHVTPDGPNVCKSCGKAFWAEVS